MAEHCVFTRNYWLQVEVAVRVSCHSAEGSGAVPSHSAGMLGQMECVGLYAGQCTWFPGSLPCRFLCYVLVVK